MLNKNKRVFFWPQRGSSWAEPDSVGQRPHSAPRESLSLSRGAELDASTSSNTHCSPIWADENSTGLRPLHKQKVSMTIGKDAFHSQHRPALCKPDYKHNFVSLSCPCTTRHTVADGPTQGSPGLLRAWRGSVSNTATVGDSRQSWKIYGIITRPTKVYTQRTVSWHSTR